MILLNVFMFSLCAIVQAVLFHGALVNGLAPTKELFNSFVKTYGKPYKAGTDEYLKRLAVFQDNIRLHHKLNQNRLSNESAWYGVNKFSDLTQAEFSSLYLSDFTMKEPVPFTNRLRTSNGFIKSRVFQHPDKVDWRTKNIVTPVKNQKSCGACWAFSVVDAVESRNALHSKKLIPLSVQEVIDCSIGYHGILGGCKGGDTCQAIDWLVKTKTALVTESQYPLKDKSQSCQIHSNSTKGVWVTEYHCKSFVAAEDEMLDWIATYGPVSVSVDATNWNNYQGGIIQHHCGEAPNNHAVVIVGYDLTGEIPYFIAKNSWGTTFGLDGYIYLAVGNNVCGVAKEVARLDVR